MNWSKIHKICIEPEYTYSQNQIPLHTYQPLCFVCMFCVYEIQSWYLVLSYTWSGFSAFLEVNSCLILLPGAGVLWWIGLVLATIHIWYLNTCRIQKTQDLFVRRLYEGALIEQSLLLNTRFHIQCKNRRKR